MKFIPIYNIVKKENQLMKLFPNPAKNSITITYPFKNENYIVSISNLLGETVFTKQTEGLANNHIDLNIEELNSGYYVLQVKSNNGAVLAKTKLIKE